MQRPEFKKGCPLPAPYNWFKTEHVFDNGSNCVRQLKLYKKGIQQYLNTLMLLCAHPYHNSGVFQPQSPGRGLDLFLLFLRRWEPCLSLMLRQGDF
jgi:hypothetical protein